MSTREIKDVTIKINSTDPGGFAGFDGNNQELPNVANPTSAQSVATQASVLDAIANAGHINKSGGFPALTAMPRYNGTTGLFIEPTGLLVDASNAVTQAGDTTAATGLLNTQTADARYEPIGGGSKTTWLQQFYTFSALTQNGANTLDTPLAMKMSDGSPSTANASVTNSGFNLNFLTVGLYFVKIDAQIGKAGIGSGQRGLFWADVIAGVATVNFFRGANLGTGAGTTESNIVDTIIPINVTTATATINFLLSTLTGNPNGNQLNLQGYPGGTNTPLSPSFAIEVFKESQV